MATPEAEDDVPSLLSYQSLTNILLSVLCVLMAALAAGLTMGMLSLDPLQLEIKRRASPSSLERERCASLLPLLVGHSQRHRLLVSLLLLNSLANEALPLFLDELLPGKYTSIVVSVTLVLFFGEIVPSAFFTGPNQVQMAARLVPLVKCVMFVTSPIATPIARMLDKVLHSDDGDGNDDDNETSLRSIRQQQQPLYVDVTEGNYYNRGELSALVRIQYEAQIAAKRHRKRRSKGELLRASMNNSNSTVITIPRTSAENRDVRAAGRAVLKRAPSIHADEITIIEGALAMTTKVAADVLTPLRNIFALPDTTHCSTNPRWWRSGPRATVECPSTPKRKQAKDVSGIVGVLLVRQLIVVNPADERPIDTLPLQKPPCVPPSMNLVDLINLFQSGGGRGGGGSHLAVVCARPLIAEQALADDLPIPPEAAVIGVISLEDVIEELLQEEIYDEYDHRELDITRLAVNRWKAFVERKKLKREEEAEVKANEEANKEAEGRGSSETSRLLPK